MSKKEKNNNKRGNPKALVRVIKLVFSYYPVLFPLTCLCILFSAGVSSIPSIFQQKIIAIIEERFMSGDWTAASREIVPLVIILASLYVVSLIAIVTQTQLMAYITQGFLCKLRRTMFDKMQNLPIKYFDTHRHGDIMSFYTNDIDTLRQLVSQSVPQLITSAVIVTVLSL